MRTLILAIVIIALVAPATFAGTQSGSNEIQAQGSFQHVDMGSDNDRTQDTVSFGLVGNRFVTDNLSLGLSLRQSASTQDDGDGNETKRSQTFFQGRVDFYIASQSSVVPYIGAHGGIISYTYDSEYSDTSESVFTYGPQAGMKFFVRENVSLNTELDVSIYTPEADESSSEDDVTVTSLMVGASFYF